MFDKTGKVFIFNYLIQTNQSIKQPIVSLRVSILTGVGEGHVYRVSVTPPVVPTDRVPAPPIF